MRIQESLVTDKQIALELFSENGKYRLPIEGKDYYFPTLEKVQEAFLNQDTYDTIKLTHDGKKSYLHLFMDEIEVFDTKKALRQRLSQDSQGMWAEIQNGQKHYYMQQRGWISTSYKEVTEQECIEKLQHTSTMTKALSIGLGMLALLPGAMEFARHLPIGSKEAAMGLIALNQKSPVLGAVGYSLLPKQVDAQAMGTEFQINTYTMSVQRSPSVAPLADGGFVVTWESNGQDGDGYGIYGQRYDSSGREVGGEFQVNTYTTSEQTSPSVAPLNDGGFVVTWASDGQDSYYTGTYARRYNSTGVADGTEFQVNVFINFYQDTPSIAPLNDGGFVITWNSYTQDGDTTGVFGRRYDSSGAPIGTEFQVNTYTTNNQGTPSIAPLNDGGFVVTWQSNGQDGNLDGIFGQRYNSSGMPNAAEFQVNTYTYSSQQFSSIAPLNDGGFVVTWMSFNQDGDGFGIYGQRYGSSGAVAGTEFQVNTYMLNGQQYPDVAPLSDGGFVVTWESFGAEDGSGSSIQAKRYNNLGLAVGSDFQVNTYTGFDQRNPSIALLKDGGFLITWDSEDQDGSFEGIFGQRYDANANPIPLQIPTSANTTSGASVGQTSNSQSFSTPLLSTPVSETPSNLTTTPSETRNPPTSSDTPSNSPSPTPPSKTAASLTPFASESSRTMSLMDTSSPSISIPRPPSTSSSGQSSPVSVQNIVYGEGYPILVNDQVVGTYTISGGTGPLDSGNSNVIFFEFDPSFQPEEGEVITLFTIPDEDVGLWESIEIQGESIECLEPHGYVSTKLGGSSFEISFEQTTCLNRAPTIALATLALTVN